MSFIGISYDQHTNNTVPIWLIVATEMAKLMFDKIWVRNFTLNGQIP